MKGRVSIHQLSIKNRILKSDILNGEWRNFNQMHTTTDEKGLKIRRQAAETLRVFEIKQKDPMGRILDLSAKGMKLNGHNPISVNQIYYCRIPLRKKLEGKSEVFIDAECRWCRENPNGGGYNSGFKLRFPTSEDARAFNKIIHTWMVKQSEKLNSHYRKDMPERRSFIRRIFKPRSA